MFFENARMALGGKPSPLEVAVWEPWKDLDALEPLPDVLEMRVREFYVAEVPSVCVGDYEYWHKQGVRLGES